MLIIIIFFLFVLFLLATASILERRRIKDREQDCQQDYAQRNTEWEKDIFVSSEAKTILCIDDEPNLLLLYKVYFKDFRVNIITATDGITGLKRATEENPDLIITNILMPGLNGIEMIREIQALGIKTPIIICSALTFELSEHDSIDVFSVIGKPFEIDALKNCVKRALNMSDLA